MQSGFIISTMLHAIAMGQIMKYNVSQQISNKLWVINRNLKMFPSPLIQLAIDNIAIVGRNGRNFPS